MADEPSVVPGSDPGFAPGEAPAPPDKNVPRPVLFGAAVVLLGLAGWNGPRLWDEVRSLRQEWELERVNAAVGFVAINPQPSYARPPKEWIRHEGNATFLWSGWIDGVGHGWFKVGRSDLDLKRLGGPIGRDMVRAIDRPILEHSGGERWSRLQHDTRVAGLKVDGIANAYPLRVLEKVEVVNDTIGSRAMMVVFTPFIDPETAVDVFDPVLDGRRLTFGSSGYFFDRRPLLYDRGTESLWLVSGERLRCVAGATRGSELKRIEHARLMDWHRWQAENPDGRLVVGADRSRALPKQ